MYFILPKGIYCAVCWPFCPKCARYPIKTKKAVVEQALRVFIKIERQNKVESLHRRMKAAASLLEADYMKDEDLTDFTLSIGGEDFHE